MPPQRREKKAGIEGRKLLALQAYETGQVRSLRAAAKAFDVPYSSLAPRASGCRPRAEIGQHNRKLNDTEELALTQWILSMDQRGYPPRVCAVQHMAKLLLKEREPNARTLIGKNWTNRFINRNDELKSKFTRRYDYQRA
jgi:hypothetical protein